MQFIHSSPFYGGGYNASQQQALQQQGQQGQQPQQPHSPHTSQSPATSSAAVDQQQQPPQPQGLSLPVAALQSFAQANGIPVQAAPELNAQGKPKRKQVKNACVNCQKACKKCDDGRPCQRCIKYGLQDTCVNSVRKERKKGIKRGPYKKRKQADGGSTDGSAASTPATSLPAGLYAPTTQGSAAGVRTTNGVLAYPSFQSGTYDAAFHAAAVSYQNSASMIPHAYMVPAAIQQMYPPNTMLSYQAAMNMLSPQHGQPSPNIYGYRPDAASSQQQQQQQQQATQHGNGDHDHPAVQQELQDIRDTLRLEEEQGGQPSYWNMLFKYDEFNIPRRVHLSIWLQIIQELTGIGVITVYAPESFANSGFSERTSQLLSGFNNISYMLCTLVAVFTLDRWGRRFTLFYGAVCQGICLILVAVLTKTEYLEWKPTAFGVASAVFIFGYTGFFGMTWLTVPWLYPVEIYPLRVRARGGAWSVVGWSIGNALVMEITPPLLASIKWATFFLFGALNFAAIPIVWALYPETSNFTLEELDVIFSTKSLFVWSAEKELRFRGIDPKNPLGHKKNGDGSSDSAERGDEKAQLPAPGNGTSSTSSAPDEKKDVPAGGNE